MVGRKGLIDPVSLVIISIAFTFFVLIFVFMPLIALKVHLVTTVEFENNYNNAQLGLLAFLSSTHTTYETMPLSGDATEGIAQYPNAYSIVKTDMVTEYTAQTVEDSGDIPRYPQGDPQGDPAVPNSRLSLKKPLTAEVTALKISVQTISGNPVDTKQFDKMRYYFKVRGVEDKEDIQNLHNINLLDVDGRYCYKYVLNAMIGWQQFIFDFDPANWECQAGFLWDKVSSIIIAPLNVMGQAAAFPVYVDGLHFSKKSTIKSVSQILANHIALNSPADVSFLDSKLGKLFKCYELKDGTRTILKSECTPSKATAKAEIALPYGRYKSILTLVID